VRRNSQLGDYANQLQVVITVFALFFFPVISSLTFCLFFVPTGIDILVVVI